MSDEIKVRIADYKVSKAPNTIITLGLGSCIGTAIYDRTTKIGGLSHIMLPDSTFFTNNIKPDKFADLALPLMVEEITGGRSAKNLVAKIAGGASMFDFPDKNEEEGIGAKNIRAVKKVLKELNIPIIGEETGGKIGRTMIVDLTDFTVTIRTVKKEFIEI